MDSPDGSLNDCQVVRRVLIYQCFSDLLFGPFVLTTDLVFLLRCEVILDVERLSNFFRRLALDHVGDGLASHIKERLDIEIVGSLEAELVEV